MNLRLFTIVLLAACISTGALALRYRERTEDLSKKLADAESRAAAAEAPKPASRTFTEALSNLPHFASALTNSSAGTGDEDAALREQVQLLSSMIEQKDQLIAGLQRQTNRLPDVARGWGDRTNWLDRIKKEDPKRYEEIQKAREASRQELQKSFAEKAAYLLKRDKSKLSDDEKAQYDQMISLLNETWLLAEKMRTDNIPWDQRRESMRVMRDNMNQLEPMLDTERDRALFDIGKQVGYTDSQAQDFVKYMSDLIDVTSVHNIYRSMRMGGGPGGGPGGPGDGGRQPPPP